MMTSLQPYQLLEQEFGRWAGVENVVACSSGTAALHLALESLHLRPGAGVIVPAYSMVACARAVTLAGLRPVFVDCRRSDLTLDPERVEEAFEADQSEEGIRAIMPVHVYGRSCDMPALVDLAIKYGAFLVEDLAEAHGLPPHPNTHAACWSFYRNKIVHGEEGGAVAFREEVCRDRARRLRNIGFTEDHDYRHVPRGHNYRLANLLAEPIRENLRAYQRNHAVRRVIERRWDRACPAEWRQLERFAPWVYDLRIPGMFEVKQRAVVEALRDSGIEARYGFYPLTMQQEYAGRGNAETVEAIKASREVFYIPLTPDMTDSKIATAFDLVKRTLANPSWSE